MRYFQGVRHSFSVLTKNEFFPQSPCTYVGRSLLWYLLVALKRNPALRIREWSADFLLPSLWRTPAKLFYVFRRDYEGEIHFFESILSPGDCVIDVGANFGLYTVLAAKKAGPSGRVLAFEPFPSSFQVLQLNCDLNQLNGTVTLFPCALGAVKGESALSIHSDPGRNSLGSLGKEAVASVKVKVEKLDEIVKQADLEKIDFIKMDVEGFEAHVLEGGLETLARFKPTLIFELNPSACSRNGENAGEIVRILEAAGYTLFEYRGSRRLAQVEPKQFGNYVAIHQDRFNDPHFREWNLDMKSHDISESLLE